MNWVKMDLLSGREYPRHVTDAGEERINVMVANNTHTSSFFSKIANREKADMWNL